jgi:hypothetical protein
LLELPFVQDKQLPPHFLSGLEDDDDEEDLLAGGYDSDGEKPNYGFTEEEDNLMRNYFEDEVLNEPNTGGVVSISGDGRGAAGVFELIDEGVLNKLKLAELRAELKRRGLKVTGHKKELKERLEKAMADKVCILPSLQAEPVFATAGFSMSAFWKILHPSEEVPDPNEGTSVHSPTELADIINQPKKMNFPHQYIRDEFLSEVEAPLHDKFKRRKVDVNGDFIRHKVSTKIGRPDQQFLDCHKLSETSNPYEWFEAFCPTKLTDLWTSYTNVKALKANAGNKGRIYPDFIPFKPDELRQHIGVYILHGLSPSPQLTMKFQSQNVDPVNGNDFVHRSLGPTGLRRHKHFKCFFCVQNPLSIQPPRGTHPNWKVEEFLHEVLVVSMDAWNCGEWISVDEQTIGFQGRHPDKLRITYKQEGDGFQCDAISDDGYTYSFYFRNQPPPDKYIKSGYSPLHARVSWLFDCLKSKHHKVGMDNLYMSAKFCRQSYVHPNKILLHGVTRKGGRGLPTHVLQEEVQSKAAQIQVRGTVRAAELVGDPSCPSLIAVSVYDTKPVHFLTMCCQEIKWKEKTRKVFNKMSKKVVEIKFLRLNVNDEYNYGMGNVDIADQLRNYYRVDVWMRKFKWWHSVFWWAFQVLIINSYVCYNRYHEMLGLTPPMTHYEYQRDIALAWIDPQEYATKKKKRYTTPVTSEHSEPSTLTSNSTTNSKSNYITDFTLDPVNGSLKRRLNHTVGHWPSKAPRKRDGNKPHCQLHKWACGIHKRKRANTALCEVCNVVLCVDNECFELFHTARDIINDKLRLRRKFEESDNNEK